MIDHRFHVGAVGNMVALPDVLTDVDATQQAVGGYHQGLGGGGVSDLQRVKGTWAWAWDGLLEQQVAHVEALHNGLVPGPLRLVDPRRRNRLPIQFASGGSQRRSPTGASFLASKAGGQNTSSITHRTVASIPADPATLPMARAVRGAFAWTVQPRSGGQLGVTRAATVGTSALGADEVWRVPLLRDAEGNAETVVLSCWACVDPAITPAPVPDATGPDGLPLFNSDVAVTLSRQDRDRAGTTTTERARRPVVLSTSVWRRLSWTFTPKRTMVDSTPLLATAEDVPGCTIYTTAWMWSVAGSEELPASIQPLCGDPDAADPTAGWRIGGGAPEVIVPSIGAHGYGLPWFHKLALSLVEA